MNGTDYAFNVGTQQLLTLNLANGDTSFVANVGPGGMYVGGATPTPEPFSLALGGIGIAGVILCRLRKRNQHLNEVEFPNGGRCSCACISQDLAQYPLAVRLYSSMARATVVITTCFIAGGPTLCPVVPARLERRRKRLDVSRRHELYL